MEAAEQICKGKLAFILFRTGRDKCLGNPDLEVFSLFFWSLLLLLFLWLEGGGTLLITCILLYTLRHPLGTTG